MHSKGLHWFIIVREKNMVEARVGGHQKKGVGQNLSENSRTKWCVAFTIMKDIWRRKWWLVVNRGNDGENVVNLS